MTKCKFHKDFRLNGYAFTNSKTLLTQVKKIDIDAYLFLKDWFSDNTDITVTTSGSTGKPKPITLQKEFMVNSAIATGSFFNLKEKTTALLCLSTNYIAGKMMLVRALTLGWHIDIVTPNANPLKNIDKNYDFSAMVPLQLQNSLTDLYKIKKLIVGGGVVSSNLQKKIQEIPTLVFATYGMTETITHIAVKKLNHVSIKNSFYKLLPNITIYKDTRNCLLIKAPKVTDAFIITNDVIELISNNQFNWLGRFDNVINSGAVKLHPEKIEEKLSPIIHERFFVAGIKDEFLGEKLILLIEGTERDINFTSVKSLSKYEVPKDIYFLNKFIETDTQKIQRKKTVSLIRRIDNTL